MDRRTFLAGTGAVLVAAPSPNDRRINARKLPDRARADEEWGPII
jgi:hypothetical protein